MIPWMSADKMLAPTCAGDFSFPAEREVDVRSERPLERPLDPATGLSVLIGCSCVFGDIC